MIINRMILFYLSILARIEYFKIYKRIYLGGRIYASSRICSNNGGYLFRAFLNGVNMSNRWRLVKGVYYAECGKSNTKPIQAI